MSWQPATLTEIAEEVLRNRRVLTGLHDELDRGAPPASWTFADADQARSNHRALAEQLATQVSETVGVIEALDTAAAAITSAKRLLDGAMHRAGANGFQVDRSTGLVRIVRSFDDAADHAYARSVRHEVAEQIETALRDADAADQALAAVLNRAATTDVNDVGSLAQQQALLEFQKKSPAEQVDYLLEHPEEYAILGDHVSEAVKSQVGEQVADGLDRMARHPEDFGDADAVARYSRLLDAFGADPGVMASMYQRLGADGLLGTFSGLSSAMAFSDDPAFSRFAESLRSGLQAATLDIGFDGERFGEQLVRYATRMAGDEAMEDYSNSYPSDPMGAAILDYVLRDGAYSEGFVRGAAWQLDEFERGVGHDAVQTWMQHSGIPSPLNGLDTQGSARDRIPDPMAATMGQLAGHPALGLEFFTDEAERTDFYFAERDWSRDDYAGASEAALAIGTDAGNLVSERAATGMFVSRYFDLLPDNPHFDAANASAAAEPVASLMKFYMQAVDEAVAAEGADQAARIDLASNPYLPRVEDYPVLDIGDVDGLLKVALSTDQGMARIAEGIAGYRQALLSGFAEQHPGPAGAAAHDVAVQNLLGASARLDGHVQHIVAEVAIEGAKSRDQQVAVFTSLVSEAVGLVPAPYSDELGDTLAKVTTSAVDSVWGKVQEIPSERISATFASNEQVVRDAATGEALDGRNKSIISSYLSLAHAGLIQVAPEMRDVWMPDGKLISIAEIDADDIDRYFVKAKNSMIDLVLEEPLLDMYEDPFTGLHR